MDLIFSGIIVYIAIGSVAHMAIYSDEVGSYSDVIKVIFGWPYYVYKDIKCFIIKIRDNMRKEH